MQIGFDPSLPIENGAVLTIDMTSPQRYEAVAFELANRRAAEENSALRGFVQKAAEENSALHGFLQKAAEENSTLRALLKTGTDENQGLRCLLQSASEEKQAFLRSQETLEELIEGFRRDAQRIAGESHLLRERMKYLESVIASPFRIVAARLRWLFRRIGREE